MVCAPYRAAPAPASFIGYLRNAVSMARERTPVMAFIAIVLFIALFAFGGNYFGWQDPSGQVQLALVCAFIFGVIAGLKAKG